MRQLRDRWMRVACGLAVMAAAGTVPADEVPPGLEAALRLQAPGAVARVNWEAVRTHPVTLAALELQAATGDPAPVGGLSLLFGGLLDTVERLGLEPEMVADLWWVAPGSGTGSGMWILTTLDEDALGAALRRAEWGPEAEADDPTVWIGPADDELVEWQQEMLDEIDDEGERAEMLEMLSDSRHRIVRCGAGWLWMGAAGGVPPIGVSACGGDPVALDEPLAFPRNVLLDLTTRTLVAMAVDLPENDPAPDDAEDEPEAGDRSEREAIQQRLRELQDPTGKTVLSQVGDFAARLEENDGGLALDLVARRADGGGADATARMFRMVLLGLRFTIAPTAPELDRELSGAVIEVSGDEVRAWCSISQATLLDSLERETERQLEIRELRHRLRELDALAE